MPGRKLRVFLCHASQDKPVVRGLYQRLLAEDWIDPWLDKEKLLPGQDWELEIEKSVEDTNAVIVFLSNESVAKEGYFQKELRKVIDIANEKPVGVIFIIPVRLDECSVPQDLRKWHYVDHFPAQQKEEAYRDLLRSLKIRFDELSPKEEGRREWEWLAGHLRHHIGHRVSEAEWGVFASDVQGHLAFGQYIDLELGTYTAIFYMRWEGGLSPEMDVATIDVCGNAGEKSIGKRTVTSSEFSEANVYQEFRLRFKLLRVERNVEFRVWYLGVGNLEIERIKLVSE